jgi:co-chaperonin GroES (HSP10)
MTTIHAWDTPLPEPDLEQCRSLRMQPGRVAVEMAAAPIASARGLQITEVRKRRWRPSLGVVLACGDLSRTIGRGIRPKAEWERVAGDIAPGDVVFVHPEDGKKVEGFSIGAYAASQQVRLYGIVVPYKTPVTYMGIEEMPWDQSIIGAYDPMLKNARAVGSNILIKLAEKKDRTTSGLYVPDTMQWREDVGEIVSCGAFVDERLKPGMKVWFERGALKLISTEDGVSYAFLEEDAIYCPIDEADQAA